jgi:hypothetical protein
VPWRAPKNSSRFSQHWGRECNPQSRSQGVEEKERAPERREGKQSTGAKQRNADKNARASQRRTRVCVCQTTRATLLIVSSFFTLVVRLIGWEREGCPTPFYHTGTKFRINR